MSARPVLRRWLAFAGTGVVLALVAVLVLNQRAGSLPLSAPEVGAAEKAPRQSTLWSGSLQRNLVNLVEKNIATDWAVPTSVEDKGRNIKWWVNLGSKAYGGPIVCGGKIFVGTNNQRPRNKEIHGDKGIVMCFRESDGEFLWQSVHDKLEAGRVNDWPEEGICSSAVVEDNRLWYVSNRCEVICASTEGLKGGNLGVKDEKYTSNLDADIIWRLDMIKDLGVFPHNLATCSPLIVGDTLFVITSNGVDEGHINIPAPNAPSFLAINKNTGKVIWSDNSPGRNIMHGQWSNPVYADIKGAPQIIFPGGDGYIRAFKPDTGELIWKFDCNPKSARYVLGGRGTKNDFVCTPVISENKLYIGVGQDPEHDKGVGHLWCIDITKKPANKEKDLSPYNDPKDQNPKFDPKDPRNKDSGLVWHKGGVAPEGVDRDFDFGRTLSTCAVHNGLCYACDFGGEFFCLDANTGKEYWSDELRGDTWSSPYIVDGHVYIGNEKGEIRIYEHSKTKKMVNKISFGKVAKCRATPVAANGVLYVLAENPCRLYAIKK
jgi:outer membrane protein assembly factor BamB